MFKLAEVEAVEAADLADLDQSAEAKQQNRSVVSNPKKQARGFAFAVSLGIGRQHAPNVRHAGLGQLTVADDSALRSAKSGGLPLAGRCTSSLGTGSCLKPSTSTRSQGASRAIKADSCGSPSSRHSCISAQREPLASIDLRRHVGQPEIDSLNQHFTDTVIGDFCPDDSFLPGMHSESPEEFFAVISPRCTLQRCCAARQNRR